MELQRIKLTVNGTTVEKEIETRKSLADFLRQDLDLTGTHVGCEHGVCGSCTVLYNGAPVRSCLMLGVQADQAAIVTVEGLLIKASLALCSRLSKRIMPCSAVFAPRGF